METLFISSVTRFELRFGDLRLPRGKREDGLRLQVEGVLKIAACAEERGFAVATRNGRHFEHTGVRLINPWE